MSKKYYHKKNSNNYVGSIGIIIGLLYLLHRTGNLNIDTVQANYIKIILATLAIICIIPVIWKNITRYIKTRKNKKRYLANNIHAIDHMTGIQFEEYLKAHFEKLGYRVENTPASNDYGADLVLNKSGVRIVVQAKRYNAKVSNKAVQEIAGALGYYKASKGMVITNSFFTPNAKKLAASCNIELWDRNKVIEIFKIV